MLTLGACEVLAGKQGQTTTTQGLFKLRDLLIELSVDPFADKGSYEESTVTSLCRDIFGGNSMTTGIFCMQMGDQVGSKVTLETMEMCKKIHTYPLKNSNLVIGLLKKTRHELQLARQQL